MQNIPFFYVKTLKKKKENSTFKTGSSISCIYSTTEMNVRKLTVAESSAHWIYLSDPLTFIGKNHIRPSRCTIQGVPIEKSQNEMDVALKQYVFDLILSKP